MSDENGTNGTRSAAEGSATPAGPRPEPLRFFGTSWVDHGRGYAVRRAGVAVGALLTAAVACLVLFIAYEGLRIAAVSGFVTVLMGVMFALCSAVAFRHTWTGFSRRPDPDRQASLRGLLSIGFVGSLLAYFLRCFTEAPGEGLLRAEYERARDLYARRTTRRSGNPARKKRRGRA
ncbi:EamA/RhaT family transporter [Streptomyces sp. SCSIO 75703]|uniref:hypothetical protein n=1 Tax=unclassified Streptomyces TaxID=2593676 RepID=UPI0004C12B2B|nr:MULTISPECIES: hypothetical protein [unclassified Streptomyces]